MLLSCYNRHGRLVAWHLAKGGADDYNVVKVTQTPQSSHSYQREARRRLKGRSSDAQPLPPLQPLRVAGLTH